MVKQPHKVTKKNAFFIQRILCFFTQNQPMLYEISENIILVFQFRKIDIVMV